MALDKIEPNGFAISFPFACGYEPWIGSNKATVFPTDAEGNNPKDPANTEASSLIMSPNKFSVNTTSNCAGFKIICIAALSTNK